MSFTTQEEVKEKYKVFDPNPSQCPRCDQHSVDFETGRCQEDSCGQQVHSGGVYQPGYGPPPKTPADRLRAKSSGADNPRGADTAFHFETGKPMVDQVPPEALLAVAEVFTYGVGKYGHFNWQQYADEWKYNQLYASCMRHLLAWQAGEDIDPESSLPHLAHAACNLMMLITLIENRKGEDDRGPLAHERRYDDRIARERAQIAEENTWLLDVLFSPYGGNDREDDVEGPLPEVEP